jgi:hypothetical protein
MIESKRMTIGTAAVLVVEKSVNPQSVQFINAGTQLIGIDGFSDINPTNAFRLPRLPDNPNIARNVFTFDLNPGEEIWAATETGTSSLNVWIQTK